MHGVPTVNISAAGPAHGAPGPAPPQEKPGRFCRPEEAFVGSPWWSPAGRGLAEASTLPCIRCPWALSAARARRDESRSDPWCSDVAAAAPPRWSCLAGRVAGGTADRWQQPELCRSEPCACLVTTEATTVRVFPENPRVHRSHALELRCESRCDPHLAPSLTLSWSKDGDALQTNGTEDARWAALARGGSGARGLRQPSRAGGPCLTPGSPVHPVFVTDVLCHADRQVGRAQKSPQVPAALFRPRGSRTRGDELKAAAAWNPGFSGPDLGAVPARANQGCSHSCPSPRCRCSASGPHRPLRSPAGGDGDLLPSPHRPLSRSPRRDLSPVRTGPRGTDRSCWRRWRLPACAHRRSRNTEGAWGEKWGREGAEWPQRM